VVPRHRGDGLKGFFWPRHPYSDAEQIEQARAAVARALARLRGRGDL
jgi:histidine triad (HIT) family protein